MLVQSYEVMMERTISNLCECDMHRQNSALILSHCFQAESEVMLYIEEQRHVTCCEMRSPLADGPR